MESRCSEPWPEAMGFPAAIDRVTTASPEAVVTDGVGSCPYAEMPAVFNALDEFVRGREVDADARLALECPQSVAAALTLLYLLHRQVTFLLLPQIGGKYRLPQTAGRTPAFCRYRLTVSSPGTNDYRAVDAYLDVTENPEYDPKSTWLHRDRPQLYLRTSGSTASPKVAVHPHDLLWGNARNCVDRFALKAADRIAIPVPLFHMYGLGAAFLPGVLAGASLDLQTQVNIIRILEREREFKPTVAFLTPALCASFLAVRKSPRPYRLVVTAGDRLKTETMLAFEARFGTLINLYGSTELGAIATTLPDTPAPKRGGSVGVPLPGVRLRLACAGTDDRNEEVGELHCQHEYGFLGYVDGKGNPWTADAEPRLDTDGWFRTGDLAKMPHGNLEILGRCDLSVNRDGLLVPFGDIETAMAGLDAIEQAAITTGEAGRRGQRITAFCVLSEGHRHLTQAQVRGLCFSALPAHIIPDEVVIMKALPTLPNGKVDRRRLGEVASSRGRNSK